MTHRIRTLLMLVTMLAATAAGTAACKPLGSRAVFSAPDGKVIVLDTQAGILRMPDSQGIMLHDCGDKFQTCLTDHNGFAFAYFRKCADAEIGSYKLLKYYPQVVLDLHNNLWIVFDASPNYMFHYVIPKGIIGIYIGPTPSYDFRSIFQDRDFRLDRLKAKEYRITGSGTVAACSE